MDAAGHSTKERKWVLMELAPDFVFQPLPPTADNSAAAGPNPLGALAGLAGKWSGTGFNVIWRPFHEPATQDRFLDRKSVV